MYRAIKRLHSDQGRLSFEVGDLMTLIQKDTGYDGVWLVQDGKGHLDYAPVSYLTPEPKVTCSQVLDHIERSLLAVNEGSDNSTLKQKKAQVLRKHRNEILSQFGAAGSEAGSSATLPTSESCRHRPKAFPATNSLGRMCSGMSKVQRRKHAPPPPPPRRESLLCENKSEPSTPGTPGTPGTPQTPVTPQTPGTPQTPMTPYAPPPPLPPPASAETGMVADSMRVKPIAEEREECKTIGTGKIPPTQVAQNMRHRTPDKHEKYIIGNSGAQALDSRTSGHHHFPIATDYLGDEWVLYGVEKIKKNAKINVRESILALQSVVEYFQETVPELDQLCSQALTVITKLHGPDVNILAKDLQMALNHVEEITTLCRQEDHFTDEANKRLSKQLQCVITELLALENKVSSTALAAKNYEIVDTLISLSEGQEVYPAVKESVKDVMKLMCNCDRHVSHILINSSVPLSLISQLKSTEQITVEFCNSATLLAAILSGEDSLPVDIHNNIDIPLLVKLLNFIENPGGTMHAEAVSVDLMTLILAYNLHHRYHVENNVLMQALTHKDINYPEVLLEKVLLFFNRGVDLIIDQGLLNVHNNSVIQFLKDMFRHDETSNMYYTNDVKVMLDIVLRNITDKPHGDKERTENLRLLKHVIDRPFYAEEQYRVSDFSECFRSILGEDESEETQMDKDIINSILVNHQNWFFK